MDKNLELMVEIQKADNEIKEFDNLLKIFPAEIDKHLHHLDAAKADLDAFKKELEAKKKLRIQKEREVEEKHAAITKSKTKLHEIKTNKEYTAALSEIETLTKTISALEDEQLDIMEDVENSSAKEKALTAALEEEKKKFEKIKAEHNARIDKVKGERDELLKKRNEAASKIDPSFAKQYEKIKSQREGLAVSEMKDGYCSVCHTMVRPQMAVEIKGGKEVHTCPQCNRFLYAFPPRQTTEA